MIDFGRLHRKHSLQRRKISAPSIWETLGIRFMIFLGLVAMLVFLFWFIDPDHIGFMPLYILLTFALGFRMIKMLHEWYHYSSVSVPEMPESDKTWTVDMLTTFCPGEPYEMVINTLKAMKAVKYPHNTYLCDEGNDPYIKEICEELGVIHSYRGEDKTNAKAGNINFCLREHAKGEIAVILDPDHEPTEDFLDRVLNYFEDEEIGYVQCVQAYGNQEESFVAQGAAEQTYHFYGPMMMSMNTYGTVQAIGANCTFRRAALDSIGGHAAGLSEDMHTAMQLHAKGWKSIYVPEQLTRGLVPSTASAYWKQQLKWARGTFELLFRVYPKLFLKLTWPQRLHYATIPLFFLHGLIGLIDILVPIISLFMARVPWHMDLILFGKLVIPLLVLNMLIRQFAQRWMLEEHERGFHVLGGVLLASTWWIHLVGFIYAIFNVKVPYIPTPKDDEPENAWMLSLPNIGMILLSLVAIFYGLSIDWNPYSFAMAFFAGINIVILGGGVWIAQQKFIGRLSSIIGMDRFFTGIRSFWWNLRHYVLYRLIRNGSFLLTLILIGALTGYTFYEKKQSELLRNRNLNNIEQVRWFYSGVESAKVGDSLGLAGIYEIEDDLQASFDIIGFSHELGKPLPINQFHDIFRKGALPLINLLPVLGDEVYHEGEIYPIFNKILTGEMDSTIARIVRQLRAVDQPIFLSFARGADNPNHEWYSSHPEAAEVYKETWRYLVGRFVSQGASNVVWLWEPHSAEMFSEYYPGNNYVQWIGIGVVNDGNPKDEDTWDSFPDVYQAYHDILASDYGLSQKPVMISRLESRKNSGEQEFWLNDALVSIATQYPEIRSVMFFRRNEEQAAYEYSEKTKWVIHKHLTSSEPFIGKPPYVESQEIHNWSYKEPVSLQKSRSMASIQTVKNQNATKGAVPEIRVANHGADFELTIDGKPFYIQGIAYNPTHGVRDGFLPLTRRQLEMDFSRVRAMGANTIRRFGASGIYDWNILNVAEEQQLKVLYGHWFDPATDYYFDTAAVRKYEEEVLELVHSYKDSPAILGWVLGNETWRMQEFHFQQPYLTKTRRAYVRMIERLTKKIQKIDPNRPVLAALEHGKNLVGTLQDFRNLAPSLDLIGINTYYGSQIEELDSLFQIFDPARPYLVSAFGPEKYWDPGLVDTDINSIPRENSSYEKAQLYSENWSKYIKSNQGKNVGGIAFCWQDKMEGTATWFGITDFKGRLKPSYFALRNIWLGLKDEAPLYESYIALPDKKVYRGGIYSFKAITENNNYDKNLKYEWYLLREKYLDDSGDINVVDGGKQVKIRIPNDYYDYRVYLYISDEEGNVVTSSRGVEISD